MNFEYIDESWMNEFVVQEGPYTYGIKEFRFERLDVWNKSLDMVEFVYNITKEFQSEENFFLTSQIRRSAISAPSNIAEGTSRKTTKDKIHFLNMAYTSLIELVNHLVIAMRLGYLDQMNGKNARSQNQAITTMINGLVRSFEKL